MAKVIPIEDKKEESPILHRLREMDERRAAKTIERYRQNQKQSAKNQIKKIS